jgi:hypothetical protein
MDWFYSFKVGSFVFVLFLFFFFFFFFLGTIDDMLLVLLADVALMLSVNMDVEVSNEIYKKLTIYHTYDK